MDRESLRSKRSNSSTNYHTASAGSARPAPLRPNETPLDQRDDQKSSRSGKSSVWTDIWMSSSRTPSVAPSKSSSRSQKPHIAPDRQSIRSDRSTSTVRATHASSSPRSDNTLVHPLGEQIWNTAGGGGGKRTEIYYDRGVHTKAGNREHQDQWPAALRAILSPCPISDEDLFEEALESPGSGNLFVGKGDSRRNTERGNEPLSKIGEHAMRMVLKDQCYLLQYDDEQSAKVIDSILSRQRLYESGVNSKLETFIRPMKPVPRQQRRNIVALLKDDLQAAGNDPVRTVARAVKAIMGAVYYDQGYGWVKMVMFNFGLTVQMPGYDWRPWLSLK